MYYAGGKSTSGSTDTYYKTLFRLDVSRSPPLWTNLGDFPANMGSSYGCFDPVTSTLFFPAGNPGARSSSLFTWNLDTGVKDTKSMFTFMGATKWGGGSATWAYNNNFWLVGGRSVVGNTYYYLEGIWRYNVSGSAWTQLSIGGVFPAACMGPRMYGVINADSSLDLFITIGTTISSSSDSSPQQSQNLTLYRCHTSIVSANTITCSVISSSGPLEFGMFGQDFFRNRLVVWGSNWRDSSNPPMSIYSMDLANPSRGWTDDTPTAGTRPTMNNYLAGIIYNTTLYIYGGVDYGLSITDTDVVAVDLTFRFPVWYPPSSSTSSIPSATASSITSSMLSMGSPVTVSSALSSTIPITTSSISPSITLIAVSSPDRIVPISSASPTPSTIISSTTSSLLPTVASSTISSMDTIIPSRSHISTSTISSSSAIVPNTSVVTDESDTKTVTPNKSSLAMLLGLSFGGVLLLLLATVSYAFFRRRSRTKLQNAYDIINLQTSTPVLSIKDVDRTIFDALAKFSQDDINGEARKMLAVTEMVAGFQLTEPNGGDRSTYRVYR